MSCIPYHKYPSKYWTGNPSNATMRAQFLRNKVYPTASEIQDNLGSIMAEVFFSTLTPEVRECIGLGPPLNGPKGSMLNLPNNILLGEKKLVEVPSIKLLQSFSHNYIIEYGAQYEAEEAEKHSKWVEQAVAYKQKEMEHIMQENLRKMRERTKCEFFELYSLRLKEVFNKLKKEFEEELAERERLIRQELEAEKEHALKTLKESMECEVAELVKELNRNFDMRLKFVRDWDSNTLYEDYQARMNHYLKRWSQAYEFADKTSKQQMKAALAESDLFHYSFTMNALEKEKEKFNQILVEIITFFKNRIDSLREELDRTQESLKRLDIEGELHIEKDAWECILKDVVEQFQKFINYALHEIPGQAQYLLSLTEIVRNRYECLRKLKSKKIHTVSSAPYERRKWEDIILEPEESIEEKPPLLAASSVCPGRKSSVAESIKGMAQSLNNLLDDEASKPEVYNWSRLLLNWMTKRLGPDAEEGLPEIPKRTESQEGSTDSELVHYLDNVLKKEKPVPKHEAGTSEKPVPKQEVGSSEPRKSPTFFKQPFFEKQRRDLKIVGANDRDDHDVPIKEFTRSRLDSLINILDLHPELKNIIIKP